MSPLLELEGLVKQFSRAGPRAVDGVSVDVSEGEIVALLGPSGCGKTTTLRLVAGFERPDGGTITLGGRLLDGGRRRVPPERRGIGFVFQDYALFPHLSALENTTFGLRGRRAERSRRGREALARVGLSGLESRLPHTLSGGQQQRVALARALAPRPAVLLLDEPFSGLDAALRQSTRDEVRAILKDAGMTAVLVTHDQEEALSIADRVAVMRAGRIEQTDTPEALYHHPRRRFVAEFLGRTNILPGDARGERAATALGDVPLRGPADGAVALSIRPEHLALSSEWTEGAAPAEVKGREFRGADVAYSVAVGGARVIVRGDHRDPLRPGDRAFVRVLDPAVVVTDDDSDDAGAPAGGSPAGDHRRGAGGDRISPPTS